MPFLGDHPRQERGIDSEYRCPAPYREGFCRQDLQPPRFWRKQGLDGFVLSLDYEFCVMLDNSPPESSRGELAGFLEAAHARTAAEMTGDERCKLITSTLVNYFGARAAGQFDIVEQGLNGRGVHPLLLRGHVGTGVRTRYGKARRAGRARSLGWLGKLRRVERLHGAIGSGRRAAAGILATPN